MHRRVLRCAGPNRWFLGVLLLVVGIAAAGNTQVTTLTIRHVPAASLIDTLRPLLSAEASVSAYRDKLIVNGTAADIATVRSIVKDLDRRPRRLIIEVRERAGGTVSTQGIGYGVDTGNVRLGRVPPGSEGQVHAWSAQTSGQGDSVHRVQALDGQPALIRRGRAVPVYQGYQGVLGNNAVQGFEVRYKDAIRGFYALPRVHGNAVTVEIYQQSNRALPNAQIQLQNASTVLRGRLGQWLTLGSVGGVDDGRRDGLGAHVQTRSAEDRTIELRVSAID